jgi:hypothetical protein
MLAKKYKDRNSLCRWIKRNRGLLQEETGINFMHMVIVDDILIAHPKCHPYFKIIIKPEFIFTKESLKHIEQTLQMEFKKAKFIGVIILAERFSINPWEYYKALREHVGLVLPFYLKADQDKKKPVFICTDPLD